MQNSYIPVVVLLGFTVGGLAIDGSPRVWVAGAALVLLLAALVLDAVLYERVPKRRARR